MMSWGLVEVFVLLVLWCFLVFLLMVVGFVGFMGLESECLVVECGDSWVFAGWFVCCNLWFMVS